ncbi:hypothetical protein PVAND_012333 [Polypedilum vanderplanki]|uniref:Uncharacterized protein n=1 Tax=Polypedilum vanderplanki TaxID=319348 RepID=A0A9J6CME5_POLVA|nr:hypothetical protein PVAND_012333 [Polypedilum vanderplanki]
MGNPKVNVMSEVPKIKFNIDRSPFTTAELIFKGNDAVVFPHEDDTENNIDLSGSFRPANLKPSPNVNQNPKVEINLNALCNASIQYRLSLNLGANATSGIYTFPNGTRVQYAECKVVVVTSP